MKLKNILVFVGLAGLILVIVLNLHDLNTFFHLLTTLKWYILVLIIAIQLSSYYLNALYYQSILRVFDHHEVGLSRLFQGAMAANFVNYIIPSAGIVGAGFFSQVLSPEVPRGKGVLIQFMRYALSGLAVLVMLPVGIVLIVLTRPESRSVDRFGISASLAILAVVLAIVALVHREALTRRIVKWATTRFKRAFSRFKGDTIDKFVDDFYVGYRSIVKNKKGMSIPFGWSVIYITVEMLTIYLAFLAFGVWVNPGVVIMGYLLANISSAIGGAIFSLGVFELGMIG
ncbi:MAG TPA: lysylphosphatidylglycerol synthase transmembrane domain-containing protein, partial [Candidatus Saccharimonadales bacterium]